MPRGKATDPENVADVAPKKGKLTLQRVIEAITEHHGNLSHAAKTLDCNRLTLQRWANEHAEVREVIEQARETFVDEAESGLLKALKAGEAWAVCFALKTLGKNRGYVERQEVTGQNGGAVQFDITTRADELRKMTPDELTRLHSETLGVSGTNRK